MTAIVFSSAPATRLPLKPLEHERGDDFYRELVDAAQEGILTVDGELRITFANSRAAALLGCTTGELLRTPLLDFVPAASRAAFVSNLFRSGKQGGAIELPLTRVDHGITYAHIEARARFRDRHHIEKATITMVDMTAQRATEERLRRREAQFEHAHAMAQLGSWEYDPQADTLHRSEHTWRMLGVAVADATQPLETAMERIHADDRERVMKAFRAAASGEQSLDIEYRVLTEMGERVWHSRGELVFGTNGARRLAAVVQDVTDSRRLEQRLQQAERIASLGRLAASVAHEFNNVLMGIQPFVDLLARRGGSPETRAVATAHITESVTRGKQITQGILRYTRTPQPAHKTIDVAAFLRTCTHELEFLAGNNIDVTIRCDEELFMNADAHQLRQVLSNLVSNGRDAMPEGGMMHIRATPDTLQRRDGTRDAAVHFTIVDEGAGMSADTLKMIFEPLFTTKRHGGTGLGLAVAHKIVQAHHGQIWAESTPGQGTALHVLIPASVNPVVEDAEPAPRLRRPLKRVLLAEDDASVAAGIAAVLEEEGIAVDLVERGADVAARLESNSPDALVLDVKLPDVDGVSLYRALKPRWPNLPVLFSTGHGDAQLLTGELAGARIRCLQKPYDATTLLDALAEIAG